MQVAYVISDVKGKGKGVFANQDIRQGALVWDLNSSKHHLFYSVENINDVVGDVEFIRVLQVGVGHKSAFPNQILYLYDDSQYYNHSDSPNCGPMEDNKLSLYALRDIKKGEELTENYTKYSFPSWFLEELQKFDMMPSYCNLPKQNI